MARKSPGKAFRKGLTMMDISRLFPDEETATKWFEAVLWLGECPCPRCGSLDTYECKNHKPMPYRCRDCNRYFSVRTGTVIERSHIPLQKWVWAIYLWTTSLKGVSSMKLHRDLGITQKSAWFMTHRLREVFAEDCVDLEGPVEVDETYLGGLRKNMHKSKRRKLTGRGAVGKIAIVGIKDRDTNQVDAQVVSGVGTDELQRFVVERISEDAQVFTDNASAYKGLRRHASVNHTVGEYVRGQVHTNGIESFWALLKRAHTGTFHKLSYKHLQRYIDEFVGRHNLRHWNTIAQMEGIVAAMAGRRLMYRELTKDVGLPLGMINT